jgi:hypothetical protein
VENVGPQPNAAIGFADSFVEIKTRAAADPSITTESIREFSVWGFMDDTKAAVFNGQTVSKNNDGTWSYEKLQYWLPSHTYYFGAIAPVGHQDITVNTSGANQYGLGKVAFTNTDGSVDLIYASKEVTTSDDVINDAPGKVQLQFAHLLSKVKFTFTNGFTTENTTLKVENITMTAPKAGEINLAQEDWWTNNAWVATTEGLVLSYRPRATYRFETITLPTELIDKVMLVGNEGALTPEEVATRVRELRAKPNEWLTLGGRAKKETHPVTGEPTGKIIFDTDFEERRDEKGNIITFGSLDSYVI